MEKVGRMAPATVSDSFGADFYGKLFWCAVGFFVAAFAPTYLLVNNMHLLKGHEFALQIFLAVFFDFAATLMTFMAIVIIKAFAEVFFTGNRRILYFEVFFGTIVANVLVDIPTYLLLGKYHFIPQDDVLGKVVLAVSLGGSAVFLGFICCMVTLAVIKIVSERKQTQTN